MPIHNLTETNRCTAKCKARQERCLNLSAYGMRVCHKHGARKKEKIRSGKDHWNYVHGMETATAIESRKQTINALRDIEALMVAIGVHTGGLMRGRKPKIS